MPLESPWINFRKIFTLFYFNWCLTPFHISKAQKQKRSDSKSLQRAVRALRPSLAKGDKKMIRLAFDMALEAHKDNAEKNREPYILHPLAVAQICAEEIGLGPLAIVCALCTILWKIRTWLFENIRSSFWWKVLPLLTDSSKISGVFDKGTSLWLRISKDVAHTFWWCTCDSDQTCGSAA